MNPSLALGEVGVVLRRVALPAIIVALVGLAACGGTRTAWPEATRVAAPVVPTYPNIVPGSEGVQDSYTVRGGLSSFLTHDLPDAILTFYTAQLPPHGWSQPFGTQTDTSTPGSAYRRYVNHEACPLYSLVVFTQPIDAQSARVEVRLNQEQCVDR